MLVCHLVLYCLLVYMSFILLVCLSFCLSDLFLFFYGLFILFSVHLLIYSSVCLFVYLSAFVNVGLSIFRIDCLSFQVFCSPVNRIGRFSLCLFVFLAFCLFVCFCLFFFSLSMCLLTCPVQLYAAAGISRVQYKYRRFDQSIPATVYVHTENKPQIIVILSSSISSNSSDCSRPYSFPMEYFWRNVDIS